FRQDLLFRLNTIEIHVPPLRERREDIPALAAHFLERHARKYRKSLTAFDSAAVQALLRHVWPGNVRELDHAVERGVLMAQENQVKAIDLGLRVGRDGSPRLEAMSLEDVECLLIKKALARFDGNVSQAAGALGLSRSALYRRLQRYGMSPPPAYLTHVPGRKARAHQPSRPACSPRDPRRPPRLRDLMV